MSDAALLKVSAHGKTHWSFRVFFHHDLRTARVCGRRGRGRMVRAPWGGRWCNRVVDDPQVDTPARGGPEQCLDVPGTPVEVPSKT